MKPPARAPKNPEAIHWSSGRKTEVPAFARRPATIPGIRAGLSPTAMAMKPARMGNIMLKEVLPARFRKWASGVPFPKSAVPAFAPSTS